MRGNDGRPVVKHFGVCESLGSLPFLVCQKGEATEMAKQIGIGPTLFLMSARAFAWFFLLLSIVNVPLLLLYGFSREDTWLDADYLNVFSYFSLGNVGSNTFSCRTMDLGVVIDMKNDGESREELEYEQVA